MAETLVERMQRMKFKTPMEGHDPFVEFMDSLHSDIILHFAELNSEEEKSEWVNKSID